MSTEQTNSETPTSEIPISFYCKNCREIVKGEKIGSKYVYKCPSCKGENVAFGSTKSIANFFHVKG
jgi:Zn finger protein HypA/HybF involved in hydrogenase expression